MRGVGRNVIEIDPETDHRRLVRDEVDATNRVANRIRVTDVADDVLDAAGVRGTYVEHHRLESGRDRRLDDVRTDEAGTPGDQHPIHGAFTVRAERRSAAFPAALFSGS